MNKFYLSILAAFTLTTSFAQFGEIENGDFESWTNTPLYDTTTQWVCSNSASQGFFGVPTTYQSTDASDGMYSARLTVEEIGSGPDTTFGFVLHGDPNFTFGLPYTDAFDNISVDYKSNMGSEDTLYMVLAKFMGGIPISQDVIPVGNGSQATFTEVNMSVSNVAQQEIFIGFVMGNPFAGINATPGAEAWVDNVRLYNGTTLASNLPDHSFESWDNISTDVADSWYTTGELFAGTALENVTQTTDANNGSFAMRLETVDDGGQPLAGFASIGMIDLSNAVDPFEAIPYEAMPTTFSGAFKFIPNGSDAAAINITWFQAGTPVGTHTEQLLDQATYTTFSSPLTITGTPDSMQLIIYSGDNPGSVLFVDDLSLSGGNVGISTVETTDYTIYPNPASTELNILVNDGTVNDYALVAIDGSVIAKGSIVNNGSTINLNGVQEGTYFLQLNASSGQAVEKIVIR